MLTISLGCLPVWCQKCGTRVIRHLIPDGTGKKEVKERIADSICGRCHGWNYTPEELKSQDEYEQTDEAKNMLPIGRWEDGEWIQGGAS